MNEVGESQEYYPNAPSYEDSRVNILLHSPLNILFIFTNPQGYQRCGCPSKEKKISLLLQPSSHFDKALSNADQCLSGSSLESRKQKRKDSKTDRKDIKYNHVKAMLNPKLKSTPYSFSDSKLWLSYLSHQGSAVNFNHNTKITTKNKMHNRELPTLNINLLLV